MIWFSNPQKKNTKHDLLNYVINTPTFTMMMIVIDLLNPPCLILLMSV